MVDSQLVHDSTVLALAASSHTIHAIVPLNSNSNQSPPIVLVTQRLCPRHHIISSPHGSKHQYHGNPFPCINHVFMEDWFDDDDLEDKVVDFDSSSEDFLSPSYIAALALSTPEAPKDANVPLTATTSTSSEPPLSTWHNLFMFNRNTIRCPKLIHYFAFTKTRGCNLVDDDLDTKFDYCNMCVTSSIPG
ncbi:hypothetical protein NC652_034043 [Populus alba x Populus x berolinensis]|nr:hypothetical protein NC652_034043 [Populus alba x Populus x berolinensis]